MFDDFSNEIPANHSGKAKIQPSSSQLYPQSVDVKPPASPQQRIHPPITAPEVVHGTTPTTEKFNVCKTYDDVMNTTPRRQLSLVLNSPTPNCKRNPT